MNNGLIIAAAVVSGYLIFAMGYAILLSKMEDDTKKQRIQNVFIGLNVLLLGGAITYAFMHFEF